MARGLRSVSLAGIPQSVCFDLKSIWAIPKTSCLVRPRSQLPRVPCQSKEKPCEMRHCASHRPLSSFLFLRIRSSPAIPSTRFRPATSHQCQGRRCHINNEKKKERKPQASCRDVFVLSPAGDSLDRAVNMHTFLLAFEGWTLAINLNSHIELKTIRIAFSEASRFERWGYYPTSKLWCVATFERSLISQKAKPAPSSVRIPPFQKGRSALGPLVALHCFS